MKDSLLSFPCEIPVKLFGRNAVEFRETALDIIRSHFAEFGPEHVTERPSREGSYLSLTVKVYAENRDQIDALYRELTSSDSIMMVL